MLWGSSKGALLYGFNNYTLTAGSSPRTGNRRLPGRHAYTYL